MLPSLLQPGPNVCNNSWGKTGSDSVWVETADVAMSGAMAAEAAAAAARAKKLNLEKATNFMRQYRDPQSRELKKLSANQFMEVWSHYDKDGEYFQALNLHFLIYTYLSECKSIFDGQPFPLFFCFFSNSGYRTLTSGGVEHAVVWTTRISCELLGFHSGVADISSSEVCAWVTGYRHFQKK